MQTKTFYEFFICHRDYLAIEYFQVNWYFLTFFCNNLFCLLGFCYWKARFDYKYVGFNAWKGIQLHKVRKFMFASIATTVLESLSEE